MLIVISIVLGMLLFASLYVNYRLFKTGENHLERADAYESMYQDIVLRTKNRVEETYIQMKQLDDKEMFSKDDDVGMSFKQILAILQELNEITKEEEGE